jgi:hypothetical protein
MSWTSKCFGAACGAAAATLTAHISHDPYVSAIIGAAAENGAEGYLSEAQQRLQSYWQTSHHGNFQKVVHAIDDISQSGNGTTSEDKHTDNPVMIAADQTGESSDYNVSLLHTEDTTVIYEAGNNDVEKESEIHQRSEMSSNQNTDTDVEQLENQFAERVEDNSWVTETDAQSTDENIDGEDDEDFDTL